MTEPSLLAENDQWIVLAKPAGMHCAPAGTKPTGAHSEAAAEQTLVDWLHGNYHWSHALEEAGLVHRLDAPTTGCIIVAKTAETQERLRDAVRDPDARLRKLYLAMVDSSHAKGVPEWFELYFTSRYRRSRKVTVRQQGEQRSRGTCRLRQVGTGANGTVLEVELIGPGKRHQIRAGLAHLGAPIVGDVLYGGAPMRNGLVGLHAWRVCIEGEWICAPVPVWWGIEVDCESC